jgi:hypothetical protein
MATCRDGHASTTSDYCSECGLEMIAGIASTRLDTRELCPKCKSDRDDPTSPYCGVCGYNFDTGAPGDHIEPPRSVVTPAPPPAEPIRTVAPARIEIEVTVADDPAAPKNQPARKFALYDEENLIGRRTSGGAQTVGLDGDDYVSRRHVLIIRQSDGSYVARLFDNTNGATLNGVEMTPGVERPLVTGDTLRIGTFTLLKVTGIR